MKKITILVLIISFGCKKNIVESELSLLNGYWEINEVLFPDGSVKDYTVNTSVDFIKLKSKKGYRKKVQPKLDGTFDTSNDADVFELVNIKGTYSFKYGQNNSAGLIDQRSEQLIELTKDTYAIRNLEGITYYYKRFEPINIQK